MLQGCVLSPLLFNIFLELIIATVLQDEEIDVQLGGVWVMVRRVVEVSESLGVTVNIEKTEIQHMGRAHKDLNIVIKNQNLKQTVNFVYLGGNLSSKEETTSDIKRQIGTVRAAFQALGKVWSARDIMTTKLQVHETLVLSHLLYSSETWTMLLRTAVECIRDGTSQEDSRCHTKR